LILKEHSEIGILFSDESLTTTDFDTVDFVVLGTAAIQSAAPREPEMWKATKWREPGF
jgi:hypothetical protein